MCKNWDAPGIDHVFIDADVIVKAGNAFAENTGGDAGTGIAIKFRLQFFAVKREIVWTCAAAAAEVKAVTFDKVALVVFVLIVKARSAGAAAHQTSGAFVVARFGDGGDDINAIHLIDSDSCP